MCGSGLNDIKKDEYGLYCFFHCRRNVQLFAPDRARRTAAASVIQEGWRRHRSEVSGLG